MFNRPVKQHRGAGCLPAGFLESHWQASRLACVIRSPRPELLTLVLLCGVFYTTPASAHGLFVFATVQGNTIEGEVYFQGGDPARNAAVTIVDPGGEVLGETSTDQEGKFAFVPRLRCDHKLIADAGMGHQAEYTVEADKLPRDLPPDSLGDSPSEAEPTSPDTLGHQHAPAKTPHEENLTAEIQALVQQVTALRKDLDKWKARLRLQDILGGIGYILGIMGLAFYFLGVRRKEKGVASDN